MKNLDLRLELTRSGVRQWELAREVGINEATLSRWLRSELKGERKRRVEAALEKLRADGRSGDEI